MRNEIGTIDEFKELWNSEDKDEADGANRAYLCALRVQKEYRGLGLSTFLINEAKRIIQCKGFKEVTIGIDNDDYEKLKFIYEKWGFNEYVKNTFVDLHYFDSDNQPVIYEESTEIWICRLPLMSSRNK